MAQRPHERHNGHDVAARQVIVEMQSEAPAGLARILAAADADKADRLRNGHPVYVIRSRSKAVGALMGALSRHPDVRFVEPDYVLRAAATPNDPQMSNLWGLSNTGQAILGSAGTLGADIRGVSAWDATKGSSSVVVGIIDTGVDYNHPDLAANMWSAPSAFTVTIGGVTLTCPAGSHGFDAVNRTCDPMDRDWHGTHIAGTIGAVGNNASGVTGVNWVVRMLGLRFIAGGTGYTSDAVACIEFAQQVRTRFGTAGDVRVLSASWIGPQPSQSLQDAIAGAGTSNMLFVAAAGNSALDNDVSPGYPAAWQLPNMITVAATDNRDGLAGFSSYGATTVHLGAPGVNILSTTPGGGYGWASGTSMATPHVSGAAALVLSKCTADPATLRALLIGNTDPVPALAGRTTTGGRLNVARALAACSAPAPPPPVTAPPTATFVRSDLSTGGSWKGVYGSGGYSIAGDAQSLPSWATLTRDSGWAQWTWAALTTDARALQRGTGTDRLAACWYHNSSAAFTVNITDGATHRVAIYMVDYDYLNRAQRVEVVNATTGALLDSRNVTAFTNGQYLVWDISGSVRIRVIHSGGMNAVVSGLFFGDAGAPAVQPPAAGATFVRADLTTGGNWKGVYGADGRSIAADSESLPAWATLTRDAGWAQWTWAASTTDARALQRSAGTDRLAACWYHYSTYTFTVSVTDGTTRRIALYMVDYDGLSRVQRVDVMSAATGALLDTRTVTAFTSGQYLVWDIAGSVRIRVTHTGGVNAVVSGLFFGGAGAAPAPRTTASFVRADLTTGGSWKGAYGASGYSIAADTQSLPAWATLARDGGWNQWTWAASTTDTRAVQRPAGTDRLAACWYQYASATFALNVTDGAAHRVALYMVDYDNYSRAQRVEVLDAATGALLDSRTVTGFAGGQYLVWDISGNVLIRVTLTGGINAVVSAVFFG